ncbi:MAG: prolyl oligopeptidase family serine peptidase [Acidobacteriota bacterium]|nr:prolyl oligopeptidase family serine peptidase [Acidobacteriota bacterium]
MKDYRSNIRNFLKHFLLSVQLLVLLDVSPAFAQGSKQPDGTIVENVQCATPAKKTYEQYLKDQKASLEEEVKTAAAEGYKVNYLEDFDRFVMSREEFERRESFADYECRKIKYLSDGLRVVGFIWKPRNISGKKLPLVIANRGGNPNLALLTPRSIYYPYVTNNFVVIGSQYRGADGGEGKDEFGGADVNDVLNLIPLARSLGYVDMKNVFMHGFSRGGMQAFLAIKKGIPINAVAVQGALTDLQAAAKERPGVAARVWGKLIPGFAEKSEEVMRERSAVFFADKINVPILILQGGADWRSNTGSQALGLANKLQSLGKTYELHIYAGDDHGISVNRLERERKTVEWFKRYMK